MRKLTRWKRRLGNQTHKQKTGSFRVLRAETAQNSLLISAILKMNYRLGMVAHAYNPSTLGRPRQADLLSPGVQGQAEQHGETLSLQKLQKKLAGNSDLHL